MKLLTLLLFSVLISSCSFNVVEEIYFRENRTADLKISLDFAKSLSAENRDFIISMVSQSVKGISDKVSGKKTGTDSLKIAMDKALSQVQDSLKPVFLEIALDTIPSIRKDSLLASLSREDTLDRLTPAQEEKISSLVYYLSQRTLFRVNVNVPKNIMLFEVELKSVSWDSLMYYDIASLKNIPGGNEGLNNLITDLFPVWNGKEIVRTDNSFNILQMVQQQEANPQAKKSFEDSRLIVRYHFPKKILNNGNPQYKISSDGQTAEFNRSLYDIYKNKLSLQTTIKYQ